MTTYVNVTVDAGEVLDQLEDDDIKREASRRGLLIFKAGNNAIERAISHLHRGEVHHAIAMLDAIFDGVEK